MRNASVALGRCVAATAFLSCVFEFSPALAQQSGDTARYVSPSHATKFTRYYAPYALQAEAAYIAVGDLDARRGRSEPSAWDGTPVASDVAIAVSPYAATPDVPARAAKYLQPWEYQFGHEGYMSCYENDPDCERIIVGDRWARAIDAGPAFHVWARYPRQTRGACNEVSIAFRGTSRGRDWFANLRSINPVGSFVDDHYRQLRRNVDVIIKKITALDCYRKARFRAPQIVSVGHSLGGGLAQFAALANKPGRPRIAKVFAFDPSPVTGASLVDPAVLEQNAKRLEVDQIYQSGESLELARRYGQDFPQASSLCNPLVRTVAFGVFVPGGGREMHSMAGLAREVVQLSYDDEGTQSKYVKPRKAADCKLRYRTPASDDYLPGPAPEREPSSIEMSRAPGTAAPRVAAAHRSPPPVGYLRTDSVEFASIQTAQVQASVAKLARR